MSHPLSLLIRLARLRGAVPNSAHHALGTLLQGAQCVPVRLVAPHRCPSSPGSTVASELSWPWPSLR